jgi:hypothetical protein
MYLQRECASTNFTTNTFEYCLLCQVTKELPKMACTKQTVKEHGLNLWVDGRENGTEPKIE